jgi:methionyl aminopeptidase
MKNGKKIEAMRQGGKALGAIKRQLQDLTVPGIKFEEIETAAQRLIKEAGMQPSFSTVPGYSWATCIMKNDEVCHGIPKDKNVESGDIITIDVGLISQGYHLDTTITFAVGEVSDEVRRFLDIGRRVLDKAIAKAKPGNSVYDISFQMEKGLQRHGYGAVYQLIGHGVGEQLHMDPEIPVVANKKDKHVLIREGQTLAIEVMYTMGLPDLVQGKDGWTFLTKDGSLSGMFEETVLVTKNGPEVLTN